MLLVFLGIDLVNYGLDRIQVSDDGCGINPDDMPMIGEHIYIIVSLSFIILSYPSLFFYIMLQSFDL